MKKFISKKLFFLAKTPLGDLMVGIAFGKMSKLLPVKKIKETDKVVAFWHPKPFWEKHILIVPKKAIKNIQSIRKEDQEYLFEIYNIASQIVKEQGWEKKGYTIVSNGGARQEVNQLHFHLSSGKKI